MKKLFVFAFFCVFGISQSNAQVTFKPGVKAGVNFARLTQTDNPNERFYGKTDFYVGILGELKLSKVYTMQPEVLYSRQGSGVEYLDENNMRQKDKINISYLSLGLANKFTFDKLNIHVGPTFDIKVSDAKKELTTYNNDYFEDYSNGIDMAIFIGAGYSITENLEFEARVKKGIIPVNGDWDSENMVFQLGLSYTFDTK
ncbi:porin family protein [Flavobacterium sp. PLA-1-15]|uniref:porin family protein n=1 Tax=Flavobacterium sp. PLA-1-15 TaxID=3380533 RepID=UPI003B819752